MKKSTKSNLRNRLINYSLASAAIILGTETTKAQIWGFDVDPDEVLDTNLETLNINFNATHKFNIKYEISGAYHLVHIEPQTASASWLSRTGGRAKALSTGYVISSGKSFNNAANRERFADLHSAGGYFTTGSSWFNSDKYIGVRFKIGGNTHYGWILVNVSVVGTVLESITVKSYAYQQTAGASITADGVLPVELISFSALIKDNSVELIWDTTTEINNYGFNVERRPETGDWEKVGFVPGNGNSNAPKSYSFKDEEVPPGKVYYRLKQIDFDGTFEYSNTIELQMTNSLPTNFVLNQNYPNPFNPTTVISYQLSADSQTKLEIFDSIGRLVATLIDAKQAAGSYSYNFNADGLPSGTYAYRLATDGVSETKKMLLIK